MSKARFIYFAVFAILIATALLPALHFGRKGRTTARRSRVTACVSRSPFCTRCADGRLWLSPFGPRRARGSLESLWQESAQTVALIPGTNDYSPGDLRMSFLVVDNRGKLVAPPTARVWIARSLSAKPLQETVAHLEPIGVPGVSTGADAPTIYVAHFHVAAPGKYYVLARPNGKVSIGGIRDLVVAKRSQTPAVGAAAYPSATPTLASTRGKIAKLTTRVPPDRALLRYSIADSLAAHAPFVVTFATPRYCTSRTCGPVVDVVDAVRRRFANHGIRFIHVEIYRGQRPGQRTESLGPRVEAAVRAVDVPGRQGRPGESEVLRSSFHRRARTRDRWGAPLAAGVETCECSSVCLHPVTTRTGSSAFARLRISSACIRRRSGASSTTAGSMRCVSGGCCASIGKRWTGFSHGSA